MMRMNKNLFLHVTMAIAAVLVLSLPPLLDSRHPALTFQPMMATMEGTGKEQQEKMMTISHALQGNAIFFLSASEVVWSADEHYAIYNYFNQDLHIPVVAYGGPMADSLVHLSLLARFKENLSSKTKLVLLLSPDNFYRAKLPPRIFENNIPSTIFDPLLEDQDVAPTLKKYLESTRNDKINHMAFSQLQLRGWDLRDIQNEVSYQTGSFCDLIRNYYRQFIHLNKANAGVWPAEEAHQEPVDWVLQKQRAEKMTAEHGVTAEHHWMSKEYFEKHPTPYDWSSRAPDPQQMAIFNKMMAMLHERHVNVVVIIDPMNPWAVKHTERFKPADEMIAATLKKYQIPYYDMYKQLYQNGWSKDYLHPSDLAWVAMDQFVYEHFQ